MRISPKVSMSGLAASSNNLASALENETTVKQPIHYNSVRLTLVQTMQIWLTKFTYLLEAWMVRDFSRKMLRGERGVAMYPGTQVVLVYTQVYRDGI